MIRAYFNSGGRLIRLEIPTTTIGIAQVEAQMLATAAKVDIDSPVMAVVPRG